MSLLALGRIWRLSLDIHFALTGTLNTVRLWLHLALCQALGSSQGRASSHNFKGRQKNTWRRWDRQRNLASISISGKSICIGLLYCLRPIPGSHSTSKPHFTPADSCSSDIKYNTGRYHGQLVKRIQFQPKVWALEGSQWLWDGLLPLTSLNGFFLNSCFQKPFTLCLYNLTYCLLPHAEAFLSCSLSYVCCQNYLCQGHKTWASVQKKIKSRYPSHTWC